MLILDEPTDGLDPNQKIAMRALIARMAKHKANIRFREFMRIRWTYPRRPSNPPRSISHGGT